MMMRCLRLLPRTDAKHNLEQTTSTDESQLEGGRRSRPPPEEDRRQFHSSMAGRISSLLSLQTLGTIAGVTVGYAERICKLVISLPTLIVKVAQTLLKPATPPQQALTEQLPSETPPVVPVESAPEPIPGYLVASNAAPEGFGGLWPDKDGPSSSDDSDDDCSESGQSFRAQGLTQSFSMGQRSVREGSFRKRDADKIERAKRIRSSCLTSHLVTPAQHNRSVDLNRLSILSAGGSIGSTPGCNTVSTTPRKLTAGSMQGIPEFDHRGSYQAERMPPGAEQGAGSPVSNSFKRRTSKGSALSRFSDLAVTKPAAERAPPSAAP